MGALKQQRIDIPHYCHRCKELLADGQMVCPFCDRDATPVDEVKLPAWWQQPGESWADWSRRFRAENTARLLSEKHRKPVSDKLFLPVSVGTYDCNGNPKGGGWL